MPGAKVTITVSDGRTTSVVSGPDGTFEDKSLELLPNGASTGQLTIEADKFKPYSQQITLSDDGAATPVTAPLELLTPPGTLIFVVRAFPAGTPIAGATVELSNGAKATTDADGRAEIAAEPGKYTAKVTAPGMKDAPQEANVASDENTFVNVDMRKK